MDVYQDFEEDENIATKYCNFWNANNKPFLGNCQEILEESVIDCTGNEDKYDIQGLGCYLLQHEGNLSTVRIKFPVDIDTPFVHDFGRGQDSSFFKDFNGADTEFNLKIRNLKFYGTKFDLAVLPQNTNPNLTESVLIRADTVYISQPISISYELKIRARIVSIDKQIAMEMPIDQFKFESKIRTKFEKKVSFTDETHGFQKRVAINYAMIKILQR